MKRRWIAIAALLLACAGGEPQPRSRSLRVGTSGDYAPSRSSIRRADASGFDVEVARAYARERGLRIRWVPLRWAELDRDFAAGRFDVVMSGVTVRPERSLAGRFSVPVATSGVVLLARAKERSERGAGMRMVVNAGGHLERAARRLFPEAALRPLSPNAAVREALLAGEADAAVTDTLEAPVWLAGTSGLRVLGPYTRDWKAYWLPASASERARDLDAWLLAREADGTLAALRARTCPSARAAERDAARRARRRDRGAARADAARRGGEARERRAGARAGAGAGRARRRAGVRARGRRARRPPPPDDAAVRDFFGALIDGAREIQEATLAGPPSAAPPATSTARSGPRSRASPSASRGCWCRLPRLDEPAVKEALEPLEQPASRQRRGTASRVALRRLCGGSGRRD